MERISEYQQERLFTRRAFVLGGIQIAGMLVLAGRLTYLQLLQGDKYQTLAEENRISTQLLAPPRGQILDRIGRVMATSATNYQATFIPEQTEGLEALLTRFTQYMPLSADEQKRIRKDLQRHRAFTPVLLRDHLNWDELATLELHLHEMQGLQIDVGSIRYYPHTHATAHVLGYVAPVSEKEQTGEPLLELPDYRIGKGGIEKQYEMTLRGIAGNRQREVNAHGRVIRDLAHREPVPGTDLTLTLDDHLQRFTQQRLATEQSAAAVLMDCNTGAVHALASHPSFDPNEFTKGIDGKLWRTLLNDERAPLTNKVVSGQYAPGSTFKMVVAIAALEAGIKPAQTVYCPGHYYLGSHRFHCWKPGGHGTVNMNGAIMHSCDTYFYEMSRRIGVNRIHDVAIKLGLGSKLGIDLPGERAGSIPNEAWKRAKMGDKWHPGETLVAAIGQGYVLATPLQLATMTARLVNGGKAVVPHLTPRAPEEFGDINIKPSFLDIVTKGMHDVVNAPGGTAGGVKVIPEDAQYAFGGKTGTSQVRAISKAERATGVIPNDQRPWKHRDHALFVGYAPLVKPRFTVAVIVEHGGGGSKVAAPIARDMLLEAQKTIT
ncbi:MAG: penicillin-binding protein 2 [Bdellovibrionales bacterium]